MNVTPTPRPLASALDAGGRSLFMSAPDGLKLHVRDYGSSGPSTGCPVVCLPGLARTALDFDPLAVALSSDADAPRRVLAFDYRGRGFSEYDSDWHRYDVRVELTDTLSILDGLGIDRAIVVGTSRGGLIAMAMAAARPSLLAGVVLNDIGPVIEAQGLMRIRGYVGKLPAPRDWAEAADILRRISDSQFTAVSSETWISLARLTWREHNGRLVLAYDPALMKTVEAIDLDKPLPVLWHLFAGLSEIPTLVIRGQNSDILSEDTLDEMQVRHAGLHVWRVRDEGHAPFLRDRPTMTRIKKFISEIIE